MRPPLPHAKRKLGQVALIILYMIMGLLFLLVLVVDVFLATRAKYKLMNAGDSAALAAARGQMDTLNEIGQLNIKHLKICLDATKSEEERISQLEEMAREQENHNTLLLGPIKGYDEANQLARENCNVVRDEDAVLILQNEITWVNSNPDAFPTENARNAYVTALHSILNQGVVVGVDNAHLLSARFTGSHLYFTPGFYEAVRSEAPRWFCRFYGYQHGAAIANLASFQAPDVEEITAYTTASVQNSAFFGVGVRCVYGDVRELVSTETLLDILHEAGSTYSEDDIRNCTLLGDTHFPWYFLDTEVWRPWHELTIDGNGFSPLIADLKDEYDVYGAVSSVRVSQKIQSVNTAWRPQEFTWYSVAKPFGTLPNGENILWQSVTDLAQEMGLAGLVRPVFNVVRLIPKAGVPVRERYRSDASWLEHQRHVAHGSRHPNCWRCRIIGEWENGLARRFAEMLQHIEHNGEDGCLPTGSKGETYDDNSDNY